MIKAIYKLWQQSDFSKEELETYRVGLFKKTTLKYRFTIIIIIHFLIIVELPFYFLSLMIAFCAIC